MPGSFAARNPQIVGGWVGIMAETPGIFGANATRSFGAALSGLHLQRRKPYSAGRSGPGTPAGWSAASSNDSIAICQAVVSCSDWGRVKIYRLASSSVRSFLPPGKITGRSKRRFQDTKKLPQGPGYKVGAECFVPVGLRDVMPHSFDLTGVRNAVDGSYQTASPSGSFGL
jgi:hypothetical protein